MVKQKFTFDLSVKDTEIFKDMVKLLLTIRAWDQLDITNSDGQFWKNEIDKLFEKYGFKINETLITK